MRVLIIGGGYGGLFCAARLPIDGAARVARFLLGLLRTGGADAVPTAVRVNGRPGLRIAWDGAVRCVLGIAVEEARISGLYLVLNPAKLGRVPPGG
jgi:hypothetical protein